MMVRNKTVVSTELFLTLLGSNMQKCLFVRVTAKFGTHAWIAVVDFLVSCAKRALERFVTSLDSFLYAPQIFPATESLIWWSDVVNFWTLQLLQTGRYTTITWWSLGGTPTFIDFPKFQIAMTRTANITTNASWHPCTKTPGVSYDQGRLTSAIASQGTSCCSLGAMAAFHLSQSSCLRVSGWWGDDPGFINPGGVPFEWETSWQTWGTGDTPY